MLRICAIVNWNLDPGNEYSVGSGGAPPPARAPRWPFAVPACGGRGCGPRTSATGISGEMA